MISLTIYLTMLAHPVHLPRVIAQQGQAQIRSQAGEKTMQRPGRTPTATGSVDDAEAAPLKTPTSDVTPEPELVAVPPVASSETITRAELLAEVTEKTKRVQKLLADRNYDALVLTQVRNFAWMTAGIADNHLVITSDVGTASLVITKDGRKFVVASVSDMPRLVGDDLSGLGYEAKELSWVEARSSDAIKGLVGSSRIMSDTSMPGFDTVDIASIRAPLTPTEIVKLRWLARNTAEAVIEVLETISQGSTERVIEARTSDALMRRNIRPTVLMVGTDERVRNYRQMTSTEATLENLGMVTASGRRWGLVASVTRLVHFGALPADLQSRIQAVARVNATIQARTLPGRTSAEMFAIAQRAYADAGFPQEWERHNQGGAIGYAERDWLATPNGTQRVSEGGAFAWNPTIQGAKVEDTVLVTRNGVENLSLTQGWPSIGTVVDGKSIRSPAILIRATSTARR